MAFSYARFVVKPLTLKKSVHPNNFAYLVWRFIIFNKPLSKLELFFLKIPKVWLLCKLLPLRQAVNTILTYITHGWSINSSIWRSNWSSNCYGSCVFFPSWKGTSRSNRNLKVRKGEHMAIRITIMLEEDLAKKLRVLQSKKIRATKENISFSQVINEVIQKGLKEKWFLYGDFGFY